MTIALESWVGADERAEEDITPEKITEWDKKLEDAGFDEGSRGKLRDFLEQDNMNFETAAKALDLFDIEDDGEINDADVDKIEDGGQYYGGFNVFNDNLEIGLEKIDISSSEESSGGIPANKVTVSEKDEDAPDISAYVNSIDDLTVADMENLGLEEGTVNQFFKIDDATYSVANQDGVYRIHNDEDDNYALPERVIYNDDAIKNYDDIGMWDVYKTDDTPVLRVPDTDGRYKHYILDKDGKLDKEVTVGSTTGEIPRTIAEEDEETGGTSIESGTALGGYDNPLDLSEEPYNFNSIDDLTLEDLENFDFPSGSEHGYFTIGGTDYELWNNHGNFRIGESGDDSDSISERVLLEDGETPEEYPGEEDALTARVYSAKDSDDNTVNVYQSSDDLYLLDDDGNVGEAVTINDDGEIE